VTKRKRWHLLTPVLGAPKVVDYENSPRSNTPHPIILFYMYSPRNRGKTSLPGSRLLSGAEDRKKRLAADASWATSVGNDRRRKPPQTL